VQLLDTVDLNPRVHRLPGRKGTDYHTTTASSWARIPLPHVGPPSAISGTSCVVVSGGGFDLKRGSVERETQPRSRG